MQNDLPNEANNSAAALEPSVLWTIGHSTRPIEDFLGLLKTYGIHMLVDVRTTPFSRHNPQFHQDALAKSLAAAEIQYRHMPALGGRRKSRQNSINVGWRNQGFRGYADYMQTREFWNALEDLIVTGQASSGGHHVRRGGAVALPPHADRRCVGQPRMDRGTYYFHQFTQAPYTHTFC